MKTKILVSALILLALFAGFVMGQTNLTDPRTRWESPNGKPWIEMTSTDKSGRKIEVVEIGLRPDGVVVWRGSLAITAR